MTRPDAIEVECDVGVVCASPPEETVKSVRERARAPRDGSLLTVLERIRADIAPDINREPQAMSAHMVEANAALVLDDDSSPSVVSVEIKEDNGDVGHANSREWLKSLADAVRQVIATCIDGHATRTGTWEPRIAARLRTRDNGGRSVGARGHSSVRYRIGSGRLLRLALGWPLLQSYAGEAMQIMGERSRDACHQN